jgi:serine protease Do
MTNLLEELTDAGRHVAEVVSGSVVGVGRRGSGVVIADGLVVTNAHNVRVEQVDVTFPGGRAATADVSGADVDGDVAVLAVDTGDAPSIAIAADGPAPGTPVFALANPGGRGTRVSFGVVSSIGRSFRGPRGRRIAGSLEHTAPLARGSSGGPVVDTEGRVVGLNTHRLGDGFYLALPFDEALQSRLADLREGRTPIRRSLGVAVAPAAVARRLRAAVGLPERDGILVREVDPEGPGGRAGVREGDLVVEAGGTAINDVDDLHEVLDRWRDDTLDLLVVRGTDEHRLTITF